MSYIHADWVSIAELEKTKTLRTRIRRFIDKPNYDTQWSEDEPFNPSYTKVYFLLITRWTE